jgi:hypothetical protein
MKGLVPVFLLVAALGTAAAPDARFDPVFGKPVANTWVLPQPQVHALLDLASRQGWNLFDLLDEAGLYLKDRGWRVSVTGDALRAETASFRLGDNRVDTLLPLAVLQEFSVGARLETDAEVDVRLTKAVSGFLELGDFALETRYGFRTIGDKVLEGAFGITVKNGWLTWKLVRIARVPDPRGEGSQNFIAIHLDSLFRPKRWLIDAVRRLPEPLPKP